MAAQPRNRSGDVGLAARTLAKLAGHLGREFRVGGAGHQFQGLRNSTVGEHIQKRRLPQGNVQRRLQRVVEHRIASGVGEIGENDRVLFGQTGRRARKTEVERSPDCGRDKDRGGGNQNLPEFPTRDRNFGDLHCAR